MGPGAGMWRNLLGLRQISQRTISTASRRQLINRVPEKQKLFQGQLVRTSGSSNAKGGDTQKHTPRIDETGLQRCEREDNGLPVHLKGGIMDNVLYKITMGLTVVGTVYVFYVLTVASMPKKQK